MPPSPLVSAKLAECKSLAAKIAFEEAIHVQEISLAEPEGLAGLVSQGHREPGLPQPGPSSRLTLQDIHSTIDWLAGNKKPLPLSLVVSILQSAYDRFSSLPSLIEIIIPPEGSLVIVGDLHGQFDDAFLEIWSRWKTGSAMFLFNGDFVDRGPRSLAVVLALLGLSSIPSCPVFLNRGNHEDFHPNCVYGFRAEIQRSYPSFSDELFSLFQQVFSVLPLCSTVQGKIFVCHGGLPPPPLAPSLQELAGINRRKGTDPLMEHLLWADPMEAPGVERSPRGTSVRFGPDVTRAFLEKNSLDVLVRSHEYCEHGYQVAQGGKCITVFSAPNYMGGGNEGAVIEVRSSADGGLLPLVFIPIAGKNK